MLKKKLIFNILAKLCSGCYICCELCPGTPFYWYNPITDWLNIFQDTRVSQFSHVPLLPGLPYAKYSRYHAFLTFSKFNLIVSFFLVFVIITRKKRMFCTLFTRNIKEQKLFLYKTWTFLPCYILCISPVENTTSLGLKRKDIDVNII